MSSFLQNILKNTSTAILAVGVLVALLNTPNFAFAQANPEINYQGKLTNASGVAVPDGLYNMNFWLVPTEGGATSTSVWDETRVGGNRVQVTNGLFSVMLGDVDSLTSVDFNQTLYLGVEVGGLSTTTPVWDGEMSPRKILGTVPAAFVANYAVTAGSASSSDNASTLGGVASTSFLRSDEADTMEATSSSPILSIIQNGVGKLLSVFSGAVEKFTILNNGNVGIGSSTPIATLSITGTGGTNPFTIASSTGAQMFSILQNGNVGVSTSTPSAKLTVINSNTGNAFFVASSSGAGFLTINSAGNMGLGTTPASQTTGGIFSVVSMRTEYFQDPTGNAAYFQFANGPGTTYLVERGVTSQPGFIIESESGQTGDILQIASSSGAVYMNVSSQGNVGIGTTSSAMLALMGRSGFTSPLFQISSSTGAILLSLLSDGSLDVGQGGIYYDADTRVTSIENLNLGTLNFATDGGVVSWVDMLIDTATIGTPMSYTAQLDSNPILTVYSESDGSGGAQNMRVGIGSTTPTSRLSVVGVSGSTDRLFTI